MSVVPKLADVKNGQDRLVNLANSSKILTYLEVLTQNRRVMLHISIQIMQLVFICNQPPSSIYTNLKI